MAYVVSSPGSCGEFIQGYAEGASFMVTCPIDRYAMALVDEKAEDALPDKAEEALRKTLAYLGETDRPSVRLISSIPKGKGLASSTADISAVAEAVALSFGRKLSMEEIAHIALSIEPSDATFFEGIVQFDYREGKAIRSLGLSPAMDILIYDCGGEIDTMSFNSREDLIALQKSNEKDIAHALRLFEKGIAEKSIDLIGEAASISAYCNQKILYKKQLADFHRIGLSLGGKGVICAHSGTVLGLILPPGMEALPLREKLEDTVEGITFLDLVSLTNRGMQVEKI